MDAHSELYPLPNPVSTEKDLNPCSQVLFFCKLNDLSDFENAIDDETVAILVESIQGEGGLHVASDSFLQGIEKVVPKEQPSLFDG